MDTKSIRLTFASAPALVIFHESPIDQFFPTALLSQVAGKDSNVLPDYARELHQRLIPYYAQAPERLHFIEYPNAPHDLPEDDRKQAWNAVAKWFETFL